MLAYYVTALSAGFRPHADLYTSSGYVQPDILTFPHPARPLRFP